MPAHKVLQAPSRKFVRESPWGGNGVESDLGSLGQDIEPDVILNAVKSGKDAPAP